MNGIGLSARLRSVSCGARSWGQNGFRRWFAREVEMDERGKEVINHEKFTWPPFRRRPMKTDTKVVVKNKEKILSDYLEFRKTVEDEMKTYKPPRLVEELEKMKTTGYEWMLSKRYRLFSIKNTGPNEERNEDDVYSDVYTEHNDMLGVHAAPPSVMFAVVLIGGRQYRVIAGDTICTEKLSYEVNSQIRMSKILMCATRSWSVFGRPFVHRASITATVQRQFKSRLVQRIVWRKKKRFRRRYGHRQQLTELRIDEISFEPPTSDDLEALNLRPVRLPQSGRSRSITGDDR